MILLQPDPRMMMSRFSFFTSASHSILSSLDFTADRLSDTQKRASKCTNADQTTHHSTASTSGPPHCNTYCKTIINTSRHVPHIRHHYKQSKRISTSSTNYLTRLISLPATVPPEPSRRIQSSVSLAGIEYSNDLVM